jgi:glycosyltransferase involved in cell wall biosynthesis
MASAAIERRAVPTEARLSEALPAGARAPLHRPHLCFVAPNAWPVLSGDARFAQIGGAEVQQCTLARLFAAHQYRVSMICLDYGQPERSVIDGVTVYKAFRPSGGLPVMRFIHPRLTGMWRALRSADAEVYYCRAAGMLVGVVAAFCRRHGRRSVYAGASNMDFVPGEGGQIRYRRDRWLYRRGLAAVDRIVAQNELQRAACLAHHRRDAVVIPSCYVPRPAAAAVAPADVLWVGTIRSGKRPQLVLDLARRLPHRRFVVVGGPAAGEKELFERVSREARALPNVEFTGFLPLAQAESRFDAARLFVNTSEFEGMPNTFLQAWARGVPTLATVEVDAPAHRRFDGVEDGARAIEALLTQPPLWQAASRACREHFERSYSGAVTLERYARLFEELAA